MPQVVSGTASPLTSSVTKLVRDLLENNWPTSAYDPLRSDIGFGLSTWDDYGDIDIHVTQDRVVSVPDTIGWGRSKVTEPALITLFLRKNQQEIPATFGNAQRMIEQIVKDNAASLGQGIAMLRWDGWDRIVIADSLKEVWQC